MQIADSERRDFKKNKPLVYSKVEITEAESKILEPTPTLLFINQ